VAVLREWALADPAGKGADGAEPSESESQRNGARNGSDGATNRNDPRVRVLFLVPALAAKNVGPVLEREGLRYTLKPYNLHDFLEKVSDLLVESGALDAPIRSMRDFLRSRN